MSHAYFCGIHTEIDSRFSIHLALVIAFSFKIDDGWQFSNVFIVIFRCSWIIVGNSNLPFGLGAFGGLQGLENLGLGGNFVEMQQRMQQALLSNPDAVRQVMDNPLVQQLMNDPNNVRQLLLSNPQMQDIIEVGSLPQNLVLKWSSSYMG